MNGLFGADDEKKAPTEKWSDEIVTAIYEAYPRKVGKADAFRAIRSALRNIDKRRQGDAPADWLLNRVRAFANSAAGKAGAYTPHPATWFNRGSYDDDDREWNRGAPVSPPTHALREGVRTKEL